MCSRSGGYAVLARYMTILLDVPREDCTPLLRLHIVYTGCGREHSRCDLVFKLSRLHNVLRDWSLFMAGGSEEYEGRPYQLLDLLRGGAR